MKKIYHEHTEVRAVKRFKTFLLGSILSLFELSFYVFFLSGGGYGFQRFSGVERWSTAVLFQDHDKKKVDNRKQQRSARLQNTRHKKWTLKA